MNANDTIDVVTNIISQIDSLIVVECGCVIHLWIIAQYMCGVMIAAAQAFATRGSFQYKNLNVVIRLLQFESSEKANDRSLSKKHAEMKEWATEQSSEFRCVIVSGFPQPLSAVEVEQLGLVFESESRSGGGPLECPIKVDDDHLQLAITYQSADGELWRC
jgi:hypothetical protein